MKDVAPDCDAVAASVRQAITLLCKKGFDFKSHLCIEGILGITVDDRKVALLNIKERIVATAAASSAEDFEQKSSSSSSSGVSGSSNSPRSQCVFDVDGQNEVMDLCVKNNNSAQRNDDKRRSMCVDDDAATRDSQDGGGGDDDNKLCIINTYCTNSSSTEQNSPKPQQQQQDTGGGDATSAEHMNQDQIKPTSRRRARKSKATTRYVSKHSDTVTAVTGFASDEENLFPSPLQAIINNSHLSQETVSDAGSGGSNGDGGSCANSLTNGPTSAINNEPVNLSAARASSPRVGTPLAHAVKQEPKAAEPTPAAKSESHHLQHHQQQQQPTHNNHLLNIASNMNAFNLLNSLGLPGAGGEALAGLNPLIPPPFADAELQAQWFANIAAQMLPTLPTQPPTAQQQQKQQNSLVTANARPTAGTAAAAFPAVTSSAVKATSAGGSLLPIAPAPGKVRHRNCTYCNFLT